MAAGIAPEGVVNTAAAAGVLAPAELLTANEEDAAATGLVARSERKGTTLVASMVGSIAAPAPEAAGILVSGVVFESGVVVAVACALGPAEAAALVVPGAGEATGWVVSA